jgi:hypothetical protein
LRFVVTLLRVIFQSSNESSSERLDVVTGILLTGSVRPDRGYPSIQNVQFFLSFSKDLLASSGKPVLSSLRVVPIGKFVRSQAEFAAAVVVFVVCSIRKRRSERVGDDA